MSRLQALLAALAVLAAAFFVSLIAGVLGDRFGGSRLDLTEDHTFTLSPGSRRIVGKLDEPVTLELFVSRSDVKLRPYLESYSRRVETLLREYAAASQGKVKLVVTDPKPDTKEEQRAQRQNLGAMNTPAGAAYLGVTAQQADTVKAIGFLDPTREKFLEYDLSKLIASVARLERPKLAVVSTLAITNSAPPGGEQQQPGAADVLLAELGQTFEVVTVSNQATELPKGTAVVALIHPHHLSDKLAYAVDQFLLNGGSVFAAVDPLSRYQKFQQGGMPFMVAPMALGASSDPALLRAWGVSVDMDAVVGDSQRSVPIRGSRNQPVQYPHAFSVGSESLNANSPLTADLRELAFMEAGEITLVSGAEKRLKLELLVALKGATTGASATAAANAGPFEKVSLGFKADGRPRILAASLTGTFPTAFPNGVAADEKDKAPKPGPGHLAESKKPGRLLVVADSDFMLDPFTVRQRQMNGQMVMEELNDNLKFVLSTLETLGGSDELVSLRSKGTSIRPFKRVVALERSAQMQYQAKLDEIEKRLEEANAKVNEISRRSGGDLSKGLVITPEMQREIDKFQKEAADLSEQRRQIRRGLSEDVNALGRKLAIFNLIVGPLLAGVLGLLYFLSRRRKAA
jgi:ABC-type uncharacterized transport system involved in gliding motility auxiliary subunit